MTSKVEKRPGEFTGRHMLIIMVLFFGVIVSVNVFMASSAIRSWTGLVVENSYVASQQFNDKLVNAEAQVAMGWEGSLDYVDGGLLFQLKDAEGVPLPMETVKIDITRPIGVEGDQSVVLTRAADGSFRAPVAIEPGAWNAAIFATFADQPDYEHRARIVVEAAT